MRRAWLQDFTTKLAVEGLMAFKDNDVHATFGQQQPEQEPGWPTAHNTDAGPNMRHRPASCSAVVGLRHVCSALHWASSANGSGRCGQSARRLVKLCSTATTAGTGSV